MKKWIIAVVSVVLVILLGVSLWFVLPIGGELEDGVLARVNGVNITEERVNHILQFNEIHMETYTKVLTQSATKETAEKYINQMKERFPTTQEEVLTYLIRGEALCQQMEREGTLLTKDETAATFNKEFANQQVDEVEVYNGLQEVLQSRGITMEEYTQLGREQSYVFYNMQLAKNNFKESGSYHPTSPLSLEEQFENHLKRMVKQARVKRAS